MFKKIPFRKTIEVVVIVLVISGVFVGGFFSGQMFTGPGTTSLFGLANVGQNKPAQVDFGQFWQAWGMVRSDFVDRAKLANQSMVYGAIEGMVRSLGDPYSVFFEPKEAKTFAEDVNGAFSGIGIEIGQKKGVLTVIAPIDGTPGQKAGLRAGDSILKIDNKDTANLLTEEAVNLIRGQAGTVVTLNIWREGWDKPRDFKIAREVISVPVVKWKMQGKDIAYLQLTSFTSQAGDKFSQAIVEILNSSAKSLIIDLRNDPGGYLDQAVEIAGWFLKSGDVVLMEDDGSDAKVCDTCRSLGNGRLAGFPTVILVNKGSASASEILAGALRDQLGVKLIGEKTYGKGSVQTVENFKDGSSLKITVAKWLTPKNYSIAEQGLAPDVSVALSDQDVKDGKDPQLDAAVKLLNK